MKKRVNLRKQMMNEVRRNRRKRIVSAFLFSSIVLGGSLLLKEQNMHASEADGKWEPRSIEQIKKEIEGKREYTIVWGDTLSGISLATNISMDKLASLNGIGDYNLIYAGNKLIFEGNVVTIQNPNGVVTDQQQVTEADKVVANQPIGESVGQSATSQEQGSVQQTQPTENVNTPSAPTGSTNGVEGPTGNGDTTNGSGNEGGGTVNPTPSPTPNPDPAPTPTPTPDPQIQYTVWFYAYEGDDQSKNIEKGSRLFPTEAEATAFIEGYADNLLLSEGLAGSYGVMSWEV